MQSRPLKIPGAWEFVPQQHADPRGLLLESFRADKFAEVTGRPLTVAQVTMTVSARGALRGVHFADTPPGQAKYVTCVRGEVLDVVVDLREGSPTFGQWEAVRLDDVGRRAIYLAEGLGHAYCALTDGATVSYLCSQPYAPERERDVSVFDRELAIEWPGQAPLLSDKDAAAPTLAQVRAAGLLPSFEVCRRYGAQLAAASPVRDWSTW